MSSDFNVLVTSISRKVPQLKAIKHALRSLNIQGSLIGADIDPQCIGRYFVDEFWLIPLQEQLTLDILLDYCIQHNVKVIIPTRDGELSFYSKHRNVLQEQGIACLISSQSAIDLCRDKLKFWSFLEQHQFPGIPAFLDIKEIKSPSFVVKERFGAGSHSIGLNLSSSDTLKHAAMLEHPIFQPYIDGIEYSIDLYVDKLGQSRGSIARKRILVVNGESQITSSIKHPKLESVCTMVAEALGIYGHAVFQALIDPNDKIHLIECNPRFGGASTLSLIMGLKSFEWFFLETLQQPLSPFIRSPSEKIQVRFAEDLVLDQ